MRDSLTIRTATVDDAALMATLFTEFNAILGADGLPDDAAFLPENVTVSQAQMAERLRAVEGIEHVYLAFVTDSPTPNPSLQAEPGLSDAEGRGGSTQSSRREVAEVPAGFAALRLVPYIGQDAPYAELTQLYVRESQQRRGAGAALVRAVEDRARAAGATAVHIITGGSTDNRAQAFYRAQGYTMPNVDFFKDIREVAHA